MMATSIARTTRWVHNGPFIYDMCRSKNHTGAINHESSCFLNRHLCFYTGLWKISSPIYMINKQTKWLTTTYHDSYRPINAPLFGDAAKPLRLSVQAKDDIIYRSSQTGVDRETSSFLQTSRKKHMRCESWIFVDCVDGFRFIDFVGKLVVRPI